VSQFNGSAWTNFSTTHGLASNYVYSVGIDSKNNKWFGTSSGISKFDGKSWTTYSIKVGAYANKIYIDPLDHIWFCVWNGGILHYDGINWISYTVENTSYSIISNYMYGITMDAQGNKWMATMNDGIVRLGKDAPFLLVQPDTLYIDGDKSTDIVIAVKSNTLWNFESDQYWLSLSQIGLNNSDVTIAIPSNPTYEIRKATISVNGGYVPVKNVTLIQSSGYPVQANLIENTDIQDKTIDLSWNRGNCDSCIVFIKKGDYSGILPVNGITYSPNASFGLGSQMDTSGWYCVYKGTGNSATISNLTPNTNYQVIIFEYLWNSGSENYITEAALNNPHNFITSVASEVKFPKQINVCIDVYPNPFSNEIIIEGIYKTTIISIFNSQGIKMAEKTIYSNKQSIDLRYLPAGVYFLKIDGIFYKISKFL
jgi:hypothetical protein